VSALGVSDDHAALAAAVGGVAAQAGLTAAARQAADSSDDVLPDSWRVLAQQELLTLAFDASLIDVAVAVEALGRACAPGPYLPTVVAAELVKRHGDPDLVAEVVAGLGTGEMSVAVSALGAALGADSAADLLLGGAAVSHVLLPLSDAGWAVVPAADLTLSSDPGIDATRRVARAEPVAVESPRLLDGLTVDELREVLVVLAGAEAVGIASWCLDTAVSYAKVREQFGHPIGSFQAVKHRCADMLCRLETARAAVWDAALALDEPDLDAATRGLTVSIAAALALETGVVAAKDCIQVLGGIGFTWEHDAHLYLKRATALRQLLGGSSQWARDAAGLAARGVRRVRSLELGDDADAARTTTTEFLASLESVTGDRERRVAIADAGYLVPHWPSPYGRSAGPIEQLVIDEEFRQAGVARPDLIIGNWALPTILQYGTDEQRQRFAPPTLHGDITWCQMFSEPGAGSDLASLQTKAVKVEGGWSLSGQKVWTSAARDADWAICLARTSSEAKRHAGITYFLVDMTSQGLDVRPLRELTGEALFNEIFLTDVFVPDDLVVGEVGQGWGLARTTLANERVSMSGGSAFPSGIEELLAALTGSGQAADPAVLARVGELVCLAQGDVMLGVRATLARVSGTDPGAASSVRKLVGMHLRQDASELALELLGPQATSATGEARAVLHRFLATRALTIAGGTTEVLHNVIGERILGLPR
jgi:alkylation response protein AidB-like acyl-CoA dehydrogenase